MMKEITWREYVAEGVTALFVALLVSLATFKAPAPFIHLVSAVSVGVLYVGFRDKLVAFGNPLITLSLISVNKLKTLPGIILMAIQLLGGTVAGLFLRVAIDDIGSKMDGLNKFATASWSAGVGEALGAMLLVWGVYALINGSNNNSKESNIFPVIASVYIAMMTAALMGSVGFVNPAIAFGLGLYWNPMYVVAPVIGGVVALWFYKFIVEGYRIPIVIKKDSGSIFEKLEE